MFLRSSTSRIGRHWGLLAVLALSILLNSYHLDWGLPNDDSWSNDSISPGEPIKVLNVYASNSRYKYPLLQSWVDYAASLPVLMYWSSSGKYDFSCRSPTRQCFPDYYHQLSALILVHRIVTVLMAVGVLIGVYSLSMSLFGDRLAATLAAAAVAVSNVFVIFSHLTNVDVPSLFWFTWSLVFYVRLLKTQAAKDYVAFGILAACALSTKESLVGAYAFTGLVILLTVLTAYRDQKTALGPAAKNIAWLLLALLAGYGLINNVWFNFSGFLGHLNFWFGADGGVSRYWDKAPGTIGVVASMVDYVGREAGIALAAFSVCGLLYALWARPREALWMLLPALSYVLFLIFFIQNYLFRSSLPLIVLIAPFSGLLAAHLLRMRRPLSFAGLAFVALVFGYSFLNAVNSDMAMANDSRYAAERWIAKNIDRSSSVGVFSGGYLPRLEMLGYSPERIKMETVQQTGGRDQLPDYLIMVSKYYSRLPAAFTRNLFAGQYGYKPVWSYQYRSPLGELLGFDLDAVGPDRINPRIVILSKNP